MATEVPNKYYKYSVNGREYTQATPGGISDPSYKEMSLQEYQQANPGYQPVSSGYVIGDKGQLTTQGSIDQQSTLANDPNQVNVGTASAPMYVPKGSPAESQISGISAKDYLASTQGKEYLAQNPTVKAITPESLKVETATPSFSIATTGVQAPVIPGLNTSGLNEAYSRQTKNGVGNNPVDDKNLAYAMSKGWKPGITSTSGYSGTSGTTGSNSAPVVDTVIKGNDTSKAAEQYLADIKAMETPEQKKGSDLSSLLQSLIPETAGQAQALSDEQAKAGGVNDLKRELTNAKNNLNSLVSQRQALDVEQQGKPITMNSIIGSQAQINAVFDSKILTQTALVNSLIGNYNQALDDAKSAVDAKYGPKLEAIRIAQAQLDALAPTLTKQEKQQADALTMMYNDQKQALLDAKATEKQKSDYIFDLMSKYPDAKILSTDSETVVQNKVKTSAIYKKDVNIKGTGGGDGLGGGGAETPPTTTNVDELNQSILSQTGLSMIAFKYLTTGTAALTRMTASQRQAVMDEAQKFVNSKGVDVSTFQSQYNALSKTVEANSLRNNQAAVAESELDATIKNVKSAAEDAGLGNLAKLNVGKVWAGQQLNDSNSSTFLFHLQQLREEFAMYNAAIGGQIDANGNIRALTEQDYKRADQVIQDGFAKGNIDGFKKALTNSRSKMGVVLGQSIDAQNKQVWKLFGVGDKFIPKTKVPNTLTENKTAGTYEWVNGDGTVHEGKIGDNYIDNTIKGKQTVPAQQGFWSSVGNFLWGN